jgi:fructokinase
MTANPATMVGLGELLWDLFPSGKQLGGAPANFSYMVKILGDEGIVASRVGEDSLGQEALQQLRHSGISTAFVQQDSHHPTGTVPVSVDAEGQPEFTIASDVAWDFMRWSTEWADLAARSDVICFGSLAQRSSQSRETIRRFLDAAPERALRICDVNLRQSFFSREVLHESLRRSQIVKLNHLELPILANLLALGPGDEETLAGQLREAYGLRLVCVTRGANGSLLVGEHDMAVHSGIQVKVADTVGAGDAFTACLAHEFLRGTPLDEIGRRANRFAAWVATQVGATPRMRSGDLEQIPHA